jgi:dihydrofolate reductase
MGWETGTKREFKFDPNSTENEGRWRLYDPKKVDKGSYFRRKSSTAGVSYVMGKAGGESVVQAVRFDKARFTEAEAAEWWKKNHGRENLVFSDERKKEAMDRVLVAKELVRVAKVLAAGERVNPRLVQFEGKAAIRTMKRELQDVLGELDRWERGGAHDVQGFGSEWIPLW